MASVKAVYDYTYDYEGTKISFKKDEEFQLLAKSNKDWWQVRRWNKGGVAQDIYVPAVYVQEVKKAPVETKNPTYENIADLKRKITELEAASTGKQNGDKNVANSSTTSSKSHKLPPVLTKPARKPSKKKTPAESTYRSASSANESQQSMSTTNSERALKEDSSSPKETQLSLLQKFNRIPVSETSSKLEIHNHNVENSPPKPRSKSVNTALEFTKREAPVAESNDKPVPSKPVGKLRIPPPVMPKSQKPPADRPKSMVLFSPTSPMGENEKSVANVFAEKTKQVSSSSVADELRKVFEQDASSSKTGGLLSKSLDFRKTPSPKETEVTDVQNKVNGLQLEASSSPPVFQAPAPPPSSSSLPLGWTEHKTSDGHIYYHNSTTGESSWTRPQPPPTVPEETQKTGNKLLEKVAPRGWTKEINQITSTPVFTNCRTGERWAIGSDGAGNTYYYNMSNPKLTVGELPEVSDIPQRAVTDPRSQEAIYDSLDPIENEQQQAHRPRSSSEHKIEPVHMSPRHSLSCTTSSQGVGSLPSHMELFASSMSGVLKKHGYLQRKRVYDAQGKKVKGSWQKHFVMLHNHELHFYLDHKTKDLPGAKPLCVFSLMHSTTSLYTKEKKKNVFQVSAPFGEQFLLQAETSALLNDWYSTIQTAINKANQDYKEHPERYPNQPGDGDGQSSPKMISGNKSREKRPSKSGRQTSVSDELADEDEGDPLDDADISAADRSVRIRSRLKKLIAKRPQVDQLKTKGIMEDPVFGCELSALCARENTNVPRFFVKFIDHIEKNGLDVVGIYRLSGNAASITKLRYLVEQDEFTLDDSQWADINIVTGCLKLYLRELPNPLIPFKQFRSFIDAARAPTQPQRVQLIAARVNELPKTNYCTLKALTQHLRKVVEHGHENKMQATNVAIVFGPTIMRAEHDSFEMATLMPVQNGIMEVFINEYSSIFRK